MEFEKFELRNLNRPTEQGMISIRTDVQNIQKLKKWAKKEGVNFHQFTKSIIESYIYYREKGSTK
jgi:predicted DNA binding CopG/RHH family protein